MDLSGGVVGFQLWLWDFSAVVVGFFFWWLWDFCFSGVVEFCFQRLRGVIFFLRD